MARALAGLDHRQFGRVFVLSIAQACRGATTAPASGSTGAIAGQRARSKAIRHCPDRVSRSLVKVSACRRAPGCRRRDSCWLDSITGSSAGPSSSRSVKPDMRRDGASIGQYRGDRGPAAPGRRRDSARAADRGCRDWSRPRLQTCARLPPAWLVLAMLEHRQIGRAFVLSIGEAGHEARRRQHRAVPWRSRASGPGRRQSGIAPIGCPVPWSRYRLADVRQVAAGVARAGWTRSPAVLPGLRFQK